MIGSKDRIQWQYGGNPQGELLFKKTRPDDFIAELKHVQAILENGQQKSSISLECGLDTMLIVAAAHLANSQGRRVRIDYDKGYSLDALTVASQP